ncbi:type-1 angiotensin II receptor [Micropterus salmoides]|uniref:type-1 angiotensin II receptor n=1 Tax=Micropterus salmoides TaxID=27706 RepID=UPI0018ED0CEA|nr:type-1 angiotensin II receptor [Micropterus salmoides]XP_038584976.1 type-1 angiotensin II receptor [Micropterus salmoides]XP_038584984.1 type-1 angiotensin II receptor [Micropterus salmoides]XP_038584992.1 type-1 angiotensin II receptor [Micropterus salmoides]
MQNITAGATEGIALTCGMSGSHEIIFTLVPIVYGCNFVIGIVGNSMVVAVIYCYMKLKTVANIFVLNLAVSDLTFLITLPMWATFTATGYHWPFGGFLCKASAGLVIFNLYTSIFFLTALSIDRYLAIVHPVRSRRFRTVVYARITCMMIWLFAFVLSVPTALTRDIHNITNSNNTVCGILHPNIENAIRLKEVLLAISLMKSLLGFLVPFFIIITCYCLIGQALLGARHIQKSTRSRDDEVLRMLAAAVLAFFLCWVPHQVFHLMQVLTQLILVENCAMLEIIDTAMPFTICIAYFNSCVNPIVYGFVGRNFRKKLLRLLRCSPGGATGPHPSISSKISAHSFRASEALSLTVKSKASSDVK